MYEIWVRDLNSPRFKGKNVQLDRLIILLNSVGCYQEDDIDGEHIVAFAEEDDPGE